MGMSFKQNRLSRKRGGNAFSEINVTPLVDVMLVLLIVFMVTAPMLTVGVPVDLPKTRAAKLADQVEPIVISIGADGKSYLQEIELEGEALITRLMAITGNNPDARIYVRGDQSIPYGRIMEIMGDIAASGFTKVSLIAEMPGGPSAKSKSALPPAPVLPTQPTANFSQKARPAAVPHPLQGKSVASSPAVKKGMKKGQ